MDDDYSLVVVGIVSIDVSDGQSAVEDGAVYFVIERVVIERNRADLYLPNWGSKSNVPVVLVIMATLSKVALVKLITDCIEFQ